MGYDFISTSSSHNSTREVSEVVDVAYLNKSFLLKLIPLLDNTFVVNYDCSSSCAVFIIIIIIRQLLWKLLSDIRTLPMCDVILRIRYRPYPTLMLIVFIHFIWFLSCLALIRLQLDHLNLSHNTFVYLTAPLLLSNISFRTVNV